MKKLLLSLAMMSALMPSAKAQVEGTPYFLPKTEMRVQLLIEKSDYTPGEFAVYSERFLKKNAADTPSTEYRIVGISMYTTAVPDSAKEYFVPIDKKHTILNVERASNGVLTAINGKGKAVAQPKEFVPAPKAKAINPHDFMNEDILTAGSAAKMAELTAREIYDIRDSRNELSRGEADYMPKDGAQLKIMLDNLDRQEAILLQTFQGVTVKDTIQQEVRFVPEKEMTEKELLFRFSKHLGLVDNDDLSGAPYYINIEDMNIIPEPEIDPINAKRAKDDPGITVNLPGKVKATILEGNKAVKVFEFYSAQHGRLEVLSTGLFSKKMITKLQLNPVTGNIETIETEPLE